MNARDRADAAWLSCQALATNYWLYKYTLYPLDWCFYKLSCLFLGKPTEVGIDDEWTE